MDSNDIVVLTGFGLFRDYKVNPSWEAVKLVNENHFKNVKLVKMLVPVSYEEVDKTVKEIWDNYNPKLVIHCGVSCMARCLCLEKRAVINMERYYQPDIFSCLPKSYPESQRCPKKLNFLCTDLELDRICYEINQYYYASCIKLPAKVSYHAGEFLCEYIYRCSLQANTCRTLFIHVPNISKELTAEEIAKCLEVALKSVLSQIDYKNRGNPK